MKMLVLVLVLLLLPLLLLGILPRIGICRARQTRKPVNDPDDEIEDAMRTSRGGRWVSVARRRQWQRKPPPSSWTWSSSASSDECGRFCAGIPAAWLPSPLLGAELVAGETMVGRVWEGGGVRGRRQEVVGGGGSS